MNIGDLVWLDGLMRMDTAEATGIALAAVVESKVPAHIERLNAPKPGAMVVRQPDAPPKLGLEDVEFDQEAVQLGAQMAANVGAFIESRVRESKL